MKRWWVTIVFAATATSARAEPDDAASSAPGTVAPTPPPKPAPTGTFSIGASYGTDDKFGASASITQPDLFGTGQLLSLDASLNEREQRYALRFSSPALLGTGFQLDASLAADAKHLDGFTRAGVGPSVSISRLTAPFTRTYLTYRFETVVDQFDDGARPGSEYNVSALRFGSEYNTLSEPYLATHGTRAGAYVELAHAGLGSDVDEVHSKSYLETHRALGGGLILHLSGSTETLLSGDSLPVGERLYFDGSSQIRGYAPNQVGPRSGSNFAAFGRAEVELPISHGISATAFLDAGGLMKFRGGFSSVPSSTASTGELAASAGFGLVWRSPIGPIGGYLAWTGEGGPKFVIGIGPGF